MRISCLSPESSPEPPSQEQKAPEVAPQRPQSRPGAGGGRPGTGVTFPYRTVGCLWKVLGGQSAAGGGGAAHHGGASGHRALCERRSGVPGLLPARVLGGHSVPMSRLPVALVPRNLSGNPSATRPHGGGVPAVRREEAGGRRTAHGSHRSGGSAGSLRAGYDCPHPSAPPA